MFNINKNTGFTITELIMVILIVAIIAAVTSAILIFFMQNTIFLPSQMNVQQAASAAMDIVIEGDGNAGLRFAKEITNIRTNRDLVEFTNSNNQSIRYRIRNGRLRRSIDGAAWEIIPYYATGNLTVTRYADSLFNYFDENDDEITSPDGNHELVRRIKINLLATSGAGDFDDLEGQTALSSSVKIYKFAVNQPPTVDIYEVTPQANRYRIRFRVTDPDGGSVLWNAELSPADAGFLGDNAGNPISGGSGNVEYTRRIFYYPDGDFTGTATVTVNVDDGAGGTDSDFVEIDIVNQPPVVTIVSVSYQRRQDRYRVRFRVEDPDGGNVSWSSSLSPSFAGTLSPTSGSGTVTYRSNTFYYPDRGDPGQGIPGFTGTATVTIDVDDGAGGTDSVSTNIDVE